MTSARLAVVVAAMAACGGGGRATPGAGSAGGGGGGDAAVSVDAGLGARDAAPVDAAASGPRPAADDEIRAARAFVERWLAAQNGGDFAAYQALYAPVMRGVRRSGRQVRRFERDGWMRDRRAMFRQPMTVTADDVVVYVAGPQRQVFFTQTWEQGSYRDVGTKNLVLVGAGDATQIVYEELLGSRIETPAAAPQTAGVAAGADWYGYDRAPSLAAMRLAPLGDGVAMVAGTRRPLPARDLEATAVLRDPATGQFGAGAVVGAVPAGDPLTALAGQPVEVLDDRLAVVCRGALGPPRAAVAGYLADGADDEAALAAALWQREPPVIEVLVSAPCAGRFVRGVEAAPVAAIVDADRLTARSLRAVKAGLAGDGVTVTLAAAIDDGRRGFALWTLARPDGCDAPELAERVLTAATADDRGRWTFTEVARLDGTAAGLWVVDLDGDGALDAVVDGGVYRGGSFELWRPHLAIPWPAGLGCDGYDD